MSVKVPDPFAAVMPSAEGVREHLEQRAAEEHARAEREKQLAALERVSNAAESVHRAATAYRGAIARRDPHMADLERQRLGILANRLEQRLQQPPVLALLTENPGYVGPQDGAE